MENVEILNKIISQFQNYYKQMIISSGHNASGNLANTQSFDVSYDNNVWTITLKMADYWKWLEYGRRPGKMPPAEALMQWIKVKKVLPRSRKTGRFLPHKQAAFAMAKSIAKRGLPATHLLSKSMTSFDFKHKVLGGIFQIYKAQLDAIFEV